MKIPEDIKLLLIVIVTIGAVTGFAMLVVIFAPAVGSNPDLSIRIILSVLLAFITMKFFLYIIEAVIIVIGGDKNSRWEKGKSAIKSAHPWLRTLLVVAILIVIFVVWYLLLKHFGRFFLPNF
jgi:hypothetical protein